MRLTLGTFLLCLYVTTAMAAEPAGFDAANQLMMEGKSAEALAKYRQCLTVDPKHPQCLFNGGTAAYLSGNFQVARDLWQRARVVSPDEWRIRAKMIQTAQALGDMKNRDAERADLIALRKKGTNADLAKTDLFCRDQFTAGPIRAMAFEYFTPKEIADYMKRRIDIHIMFRIGNDQG